jgi:ADP-dependent NAD(P)H-hydrate dehydratase / NAD(P)H-hydrate epimerase
MQVVQRSKSDYAGLLPHPKKDANKFTRGSVAIIAGSAKFPGAAVLASAAARCGSGYTVLVTPKSAAQTAHAHLASIPIVETAEVDGCFCSESLPVIFQACKRAQALVIGPGIGTNSQVVQFLHELLASEERPVVLDADALTILAKNPDILAARNARNNVTVITPHGGEAARLLGRKVEDPAKDAILLAQQLHVCIALKGHQTFIADEVENCIMCSDGGPELAKAGSGDVLSGMIGAMLAQGMNAIDATSLAVYTHALAAKIAADEITDIAVIPEDIVSHIGAAFKEIGRF